MKFRYTAIGLVVLGFAAAAFFGMKKRSETTAKTVVPESEARGLFDRQRPPSRRPTSERRSEEVNTNFPIPDEARKEIPENWNSLQQAREKLLGVDAPAKPNELIRGGRYTYRTLGNVLALGDDEFQPNLGTVVERSGGYTIFRLEPGLEVPPGSLAVVYEARTGQLLVVTGQLTVHLKPSTRASSLSSDYSMELVESIDRLNTAIFHGTRQSTSELVQLLNAMRKDERVVQADLELLGARRVAQ